MDKAITLESEPSEREQVHTESTGSIIPQQAVGRLLRVIGEEKERRRKARPIMEAWFQQVSAHEKLAARQAHLNLSALKENDLPSFEDALAYALASNTLASKEFIDYATVMGYRYWEKDQDLLDLTLHTNSLWSLQNEFEGAIMAQWHQHILRNVPTYQPTDRGATTILQYITRGKVIVAPVDGIGSLENLLFTGPRTTAILEDRQLDRQAMYTSVAYTLTYYLLEASERNRFRHYSVSPLVSGSDYLTIDTLRPFTACLLEEKGACQELSTIGQRLVRAFVKLGVERRLVRLLFQLREVQHVPLIALLREPGKDSDVQWRTEW